MARSKLHTLVVSALVPSVRRRAGFAFSKEARAVRVGLDRKLIIEADERLKIHKEGSDHHKRATGAEETPRSLTHGKTAEHLEKHSTVATKPDYVRTKDSIAGELGTIGEDGVQEVADELGLEADTPAELNNVVADALFDLEEKPVEEGEVETDDDAEDEEIVKGTDPAAALERFKALDAMKPAALTKALTKLGYEDEGEKDAKIRAILEEEFEADALTDIDYALVTQEAAQDATAAGEGDQGGTKTKNAAKPATKAATKKAAGKASKKK